MSESDVPPPEPSSSPKEPHPREERAEAGVRVQWLHVLAIGLATAAVIGFVTGTRGDQDPYRRPEHEMPSEDAESIPLTPSYGDIRDAPLGPNRERHATAIAAMRAAHPGLTEEVPPRDDEAVRAELERRSELRAYNGAPPRIPHPIAPRGPLDCVGCHLEGMQVGGHVAPPMSHSADLQSCTQCHVPAEGQLPGDRLEGGPPFADNAFAGMEAPMRGPRMWEGAPPQIPHTTQMRERCDSCHGVWGRGIRTTHPWRQSCQQCHTRSGQMDQHPSTLQGGPPVSPMPGEGS